MPAVSLQNRMGHQSLGRASHLTIYQLKQCFTAESAPRNGAVLVRFGRNRIKHLRTHFGEENSPKPLALHGFLGA